MSAAMRKPRLSDLEDEIAGHIRQSPLAGIKVPRLLNNEDTEFNLDTITLEQMKSVLPWAHMTRGAWNDDTYKLVRLICDYAEASRTSPDTNFEEYAAKLCGGEQRWKKLVSPLG